MKAKIVLTNHFRETDNEKSLKLRYSPIDESRIRCREFCESEPFPYFEVILPNASDYSLNTKGKLACIHVYHPKDEMVYKEIDPYYVETENQIYVDYIDNFGNKISASLPDLMMETFKPISNNEAYEVRHRDNDPFNNRLENLERVKLNIDPTLDKGIVARNVISRVEKVYDDIDSCSKDLNISKSEIIKTLNNPSIDHIRPDDWQFKDRQDKRVWGDITMRYLLENRTSQLYRVRLLPSKEIRFFPTLEEASKFLGVSVPLLSIILKDHFYSLKDDYYSPIRANLIKKGEKAGTVFQIAMVPHEQPWKEYPTLQHAIQDANKGSYVVVSIDKDNQVTFYRNLEEASKKTNIGKTTIVYRLSKNTTNPWDDGRVWLTLDAYYELVNEMILPDIGLIYL